MFNIEKKVIEFCEKHLCELFLVIISILALVARRAVISFPTYDLKVLQGWFETLVSSGGLKGLATVEYNYGPLYLDMMALVTYITPYLPADFLKNIVKLVHIAFDFPLAVTIGYLTAYLSKNNKKIMFTLGYSLCLFIPTVFMNASMWGQCDSIFTTFSVLSLIFLFKEDYLKSFIIFGIAFSFKQQAILIIPIYVIYYICKKKFSILYFLLIPLVFVCSNLPAVFAGRSLSSCLKVYMNQPTMFTYAMEHNTLNIWNLFDSIPYLMYTVAEIFGIVLCGLTLFYCVWKKPKFNNEQILTLTLWILIAMTYVLPAMHERYLYLGEVLAIVYLLVYKKNFTIMNFVIFSPILTYTKYLLHLEIENFTLIIFIYLGLIIAYTISTINVLNDDKQSNHLLDKVD